MNRRFLVGVLIASLSVLPLTAAGAAEERGFGTATTSVSLASLSLDGLPTALSELSLGTLLSYASTDADGTLNALGEGKPFALSSVVLPVVGETSVSSDGSGFDPGQTVTLPGSLGTVTAGRLNAYTTATSATSTIHALEGSLDAVIADLAVGLPDTGAFSVVDGTAARALNGAALENITLDLTDLLPLDLLNELPLDVLLDLVDELGLDLDLGSVLNQLRADVEKLLAELEELAGVEAQLEAVLEQLDGLPSLADAITEVTDLTAQLGLLEDQVDPLTAARDTAKTAYDTAAAGIPTLEGAVDDALAAIAAQGGIIGSVAADVACDDPILAGLLNAAGNLCTNLANAESALASAVAALVPLEEALNLAQETLDNLLDDILQFTEDLDAATLVRNLVQTLTTALQGLLTLINTLLDSILELVEGIDLGQLLGLVQGLVDGLAGLELLSIGEVIVGVESDASAAGSKATALCRVDGLRVLGDAVGASTCDQAQAALGDVRATVLDLVGSLPLVADVTSNMVRIDGLTTTTSADDAKDGNYYTASSTVEGLRLEVDPLNLTQTTDGLVGLITGTVDDVLEQLLGLLGGDVGIVSAEAAALPQELLDLLDAELVSELLAVLTGLLDGLGDLPLPTGDLAGVTTPRLAMNALDIGSSATYSAAGFGTPITTPVPPAVPVGAPPSVTPQVPLKQLPQTGGGMALALMLLVGGGALAYASRRKPEVE